MSQISTVIIPCLVFKLNNQDFLSQDQMLGRVMDVPCRDVFIDEILYWASPIKDEGILAGLEFVLSTEAKPTFDSFLVQRIRDKQSLYTWWVYVETNNDFKNSCATCCGDAAVPMPGVISGYNPRFAPCQKTCINGSGENIFIFAIPELEAGKKYLPYGGYNNVPLPSADPDGYDNLVDLLYFMNHSWATIGSPSISCSWAADGITLSASTGLTVRPIGDDSENDILCVSVVLI